MDFQNEHLSSCVPMTHLATYVKDCLHVASRIVSVGSGNGMYEHELCDQLDGLKEKLILVDPAPESFVPYSLAKGRSIKPDYETVKKLIEKEKNIVGNCVLLLIWPDPIKDYDIEAVQLLKPQSIILMHENPPDWVGGCAGSRDMAIFTMTPELFNYKCIATTNYRFKNATTPLGSIYPKLSWFARRGSSVPKKKASLLLQAAANVIPDNKYTFYMPSD